MVSDSFTETDRYGAGVDPKVARALSLTYAIGDIHGRLDLLMTALTEIASHASGRAHTIVTLGDYVDRGPHSYQVVEALRWRQGERFICLKGNHEDMMVEAVEGRAEMDWWLGNGGDATLASYPGMKVPQAHLDWCRSLPMIHSDGLRIFVHADVDETKPLADQTEARMLWSRRNRNTDCEHPAGYVVHGHTPFPDGPVVLAGRCNLDTYAVRSGRLSVAVFDNAVPGGPVEILTIKEPSHD